MIFLIILDYEKRERVQGSDYMTAELKRDPGFMRLFRVQSSGYMQTK